MLDASVALEQGGAPREVTSQKVGFVYHVCQLLTQRAPSPPTSVSTLRPKVLAGKTHAALTGDKVSKHLHLQAIRVGCHRYGNKVV
eukprot:2795883-Prymnesium_polylepis.1